MSVVGGVPDHIRASVAGSAPRLFEEHAAPQLKQNGYSDASIALFKGFLQESMQELLHPHPIVTNTASLANGLPTLKGVMLDPALFETSAASFDMKNVSLHASVTGGEPQTLTDIALRGVASIKNSGPDGTGRA